jgi:hypothetical protein
MQRVLFFVDGFTFRRINDFHRDEACRPSRINVAGLDAWLRDEIARRPGLCDGPFVVEKRFYHPAADPRMGFFGTQGRIRSLNFEQKLSDAGFQVLYTPFKQVESLKPNFRLASDALAEARSPRRPPALFVLLSTQRHFAQLLLDMGALGVPCLLIGWQANCRCRDGRPILWKTDEGLRACAPHYTHFEHVLQKDSRLLIRIPN